MRILQNIDLFSNTTSTSRNGRDEIDHSFWQRIKQRAKYLRCAAVSYYMLDERCE